MPELPAPRDPAGSSALSSIPAAGARRALPPAAQLRFFYGPMDCGKSTLALQIDHNHARQGRRGLLLTQHDRSAQPVISSRMGVGRPAREVGADTDICQLVRAEWSRGDHVDYLIVDEAQFLTPEQIDQLAVLADDCDVDVYAFGLLTDFRSRLFPGSKRLVELADELTRLQVDVLCWCGRIGAFNGRVAGDRLVKEGAQVVVADTVSAAEWEVRYQVLCRRHWRSGDLGPAAPSAQTELNL